MEHHTQWAMIHMLEVKKTSLIAVDIVLSLLKKKNTRLENSDDVPNLTNVCLGIDLFSCSVLLCKVQNQDMTHY